MTSTLDDDAVSSTAGHTLSVKFEVESCTILGTVTISAPTITDPLITLEDNTSASATFTDAGDSSGAATCGTRTYAIVEAAYSWVTVTSTAASSGDTITVSASPVGVAAATYAVTLRISSTDYTTSQIADKDVSINIVVSGDCDASASAASASIADVSYSLTGSTAAVTRVIPLLTQGSTPCVYNEAYTFSPDWPTNSAYPWITFDAASRTITIDESLDSNSSMNSVVQVIAITVTLDDSSST